MFIDQEWKKEKKSIPDTIEESDSGPIYKNPYFLVGLTIFVSFILIIVIVLSYLYKPQITFYQPSTKISDAGVGVVSTSTLTGLPSDNSDNTDDGKGILNFDELQAEYLHFGQFYRPYAKEFDIKLEGYDLPINIKSDVVNYYDLSRKIELSDSIDDLNNNGFAFLGAQLGSELSDFFSMHRKLEKIDTPLLLTTDMVWYYHQNSLKAVFKEIEKNVFYEYVWDINKKLYDISLSRYRKNLSELGQVNDVVLEAQRLETAFLATTLALLKPKNEQIIWDKNFVDKNLFSAQESDFYFFDMPPDIARDVDRELKNISTARHILKSPIMLYDIDYERFSVPENYSYNAKLKNFYLATQWLRNSFPLYYQSENCPDCTLDYNDWLINFIAANYLARDLNDNQNLKNKWAVVYKFIAFFEGLRSELTYLHYNKVVSELHPVESSLKEVFFENDLVNKDVLEKMQSRLSAITFLPIEGGLARDEIDQRQNIGMRLLQDHFCPDDYFFKQLQGGEMSIIETDSKKPRVTMCGSNSSPKYRCLPFGADILSVLDYRPVEDDYFDNNIKYEEYESKVSMIRGQLDKFNVGNWNSNIYWVNMNVAEAQIDFSSHYQSKLSLSSKWKEKNQNTILGAWTNTNLSDEEFVNYEEDSRSGLGQYLSCNKHNYIEPNLYAYRDMLARGEMLYDLINVLPVGKKTNVAAIAVKELNSEIRGIVAVVERQLLDQEINDDDCNFISEFATGLAVGRKEESSFLMGGGEGRRLYESISGTRLLVLIYERGGQKRAAIGPIFNYQEGLSKK